MNTNALSVFFGKNVNVPTINKYGNEVRKDVRYALTENKHGDEVSVGTMALKEESKAQQEDVVVAQHSTDLFEQEESTVAKQSRPWEKALPVKKKKMEPKRPIRQIEKTANEEDGEEGYTLGNFLSMSMLQSKLEDETEKNDIDFDDMWDALSTDISTAIEFKRKEKEKTHKKRKKESRREKEVGKRESARRLQLFEKKREQTTEASKGEKEHFSTEFLTAINNVFDRDAGTSDDESILEHIQEGEIVGSPDGSLKTDGDFRVGERTISSDYSKGFQSPGSKVLRSGHKGSLDGKRDQSSPVAKMSEKSRVTDKSGKSGRASRRSKSSHRSGGRSPSTLQASSRRSEGFRSAPPQGSKAVRSRKPKVNAVEIFEAELQKQQQVKELSVNSLRQEMRNRKGFSVHTLKRELAKNRKQRHSKKNVNQIQLDEKARQDRPRHGKKHGETGVLVTNEHSSRWDAGEKDTGVDDLRPELFQRQSGGKLSFSGDIR